MQSLNESKIELNEVTNRREDLDSEETRLDDQPTLIDSDTLNSVLASIKHSSIRSQDKVDRSSFDSDIGELNRRSLDEMNGIEFRYVFPKFSCRHNG